MRQASENFMHAIWASEYLPWQLYQWLQNPLVFLVSQFSKWWNDVEAVLLVLSDCILQIKDARTASHHIGLLRCLCACLKGNEGK